MSQNDLAFTRSSLYGTQAELRALCNQYLGVDA